MALLKDIVERRLEELGISPPEASRRGGLDRGFVADIVYGRKKSVSHEQLPRLAAALDCSVGYLVGETDNPQGFRNELDIEGVVEAGVWRLQTAPPQLPKLPLVGAPNPLGRQIAFLVRDDGADLLGITDGMVVVGIRYDDARAFGRHLRTGDVVVVRQVRDDGAEFSTSIREVVLGDDGTAALELRSRRIEVPAIPFHEGGDNHHIDVMALVTRGVKVFNL